MASQGSENGTHHGHEDGGKSSHGKAQFQRFGRRQPQEDGERRLDLITHKESAPAFRGISKSRYGKSFSFSTNSVNFWTQFGVNCEVITRTNGGYGEERERPTAAHPGESSTAKKSTAVVAPLSLTDEVASPAPLPSSLLLYNITDKPPWHLAILLGLQMFFVSGLNTLLQITFGVRLPIVQGGTFSFLGPSLSILALPQWQCPNETTIDAMEYDDRQELWQSRMRRFV
ncbi:hypothetical protein BV898_13998 [Hypsibius exemplaris]|uniref:Solute carrier family 23 member 2 n=1 Tax=Hypsibius exemplaris TaxID=2072580 RepID=A0A1W0W983_HYPEX|nr:hypothetical protein BV898_13998 [Hypsibius exemplaris]